MRRIQAVVLLIAASQALVVPVHAAASLEGTAPALTQTPARSATMALGDVPQQSTSAPFTAPAMTIPADQPMPAGVAPPTRSEPAPAEGDPDPDPEPAPPTLYSSFQALNDNNASIPPDTHGAVGPSHLMTTLNTQVRVQNRAGTTLSTVTLNAFWAGLGSPAAFDPKVLYDPYGGRWIFTATANARAANSAVLIGVSTSSDPTGSWNLFSYDADAGDATWADYPSIGFNKDWAAVSVNMFTHAGSFVSTKLYAFRKGSHYTNTSPSAAVWNLTSTFCGGSSCGNTHAPAITQDASLATLYLLNTWNSGAGSLRLFHISGAVGSEVFTWTSSFPAYGSGWDFSPASTEFAPQAGASVRINNNDARMQNVVYRNGALWAAHTVFLPAGGSSRSAAQWWQISTSGSVIQKGRVEDTGGTFYYAFPSIAVNANNDALLGYSRFSGGDHASAGYAFRYGTDAANTMTTTAISKAGEGVYHKTFSGTRNRWGDYSGTVTDPVNDKDLWTIQEYAATPVGTGNGSGRWGTWWSRIVPVSAPGISVNPASLPFGDMGVGTPSGPLTVTVTSSGTAPLTVGSPTIGGANPGDFAVTTNTCTGSLAPNATCSIAVRFTPSTTGARSGSLTIGSNAPGSPPTVALSGTGILDATPPVSTWTTTTNSVRVGGVHTVLGMTTDASSPVASVTVLFTPLSGAAITANASRTCGAPQSCSWSVVTPLLPSVYTARARGVDAIGNTESPGPAITIVVV